MLCQLRYLSYMQTMLNLYQISSILIYSSTQTHTHTHTHIYIYTYTYTYNDYMYIMITEIYNDDIYIYTHTYIYILYIFFSNSCRCNLHHPETRFSPGQHWRCDGQSPGRFSSFGGAGRSFRSVRINRWV